MKLTLHEFIKGTGYKVNMPKSTIFLYTSNEYSESYILKCHLKYHQNWNTSVLFYQIYINENLQNTEGKKKNQRKQLNEEINCVPGLSN